MKKKIFILGTASTYLFNIISIVVGIIAVPISLNIAKKYCKNGINKKD